MEELAENVNAELSKSGRCLVVASEGFDVGNLGEVKDAFGHVEFSASRQTVQQVVVNYLNSVGLKARGAARGQVPGTDQRDTMIYASTVDLDEAYKVGQKAVEIAVLGENGWMATILRKPGSVYSVTFDQVPLEKVANSERAFPKAWLAANRIDVTDEFVEYALPLIGNDWVSVPLINGIQRFARMRPVFAEKKLKPYTPQAYRQEF